MVDANTVARVTGITVNHVDLRGELAQLLPQQVAVIGQGATAATYATDPVTLNRSRDVGDLFGFGSPLHLAARELMPDNNDGIGLVPVTFYPMEDEGGATAAAGDITPSGTHVGNATYYVIISGVRSAPITITDGELAADLEARITAAINASINMPVVASAGADVVDLDAKWAGASGNDIAVSIEGPSQGITFAITQPTGGATNPDVDTPIALIGDKWETLIVNCLEASDIVTFGKYDAWNEGRWGATVKKPAAVLTGSTLNLAANAAFALGRKSDRTNGYATAPGSSSLPLQIAARNAARLARQANNNPPVDYCGQKLQGIDPAGVADRWDFADRQTAVAGGVSTTEYVDGVLEMSNTVTFYRPDGETPPAYAHVVDIVKLQNLIFNINAIFESDDWKGAPLIPDHDATNNPAAKKPKNAVADVNSMLDALGGKAIVADVEAAKKRTTAVINDQNPKRLDVSVTTAISGNAHVFDVTLNWAFYFGTQPTIQ